MQSFGAIFKNPMGVHTKVVDTQSKSKEKKR